MRTFPFAVLARNLMFVATFVFCFGALAAENEFAEANMLYRESIMFYAFGDYKEAVARLEEIQKKAPSYPHIKQALMNEAFFLYLDEKYPEAAAVADTYIDVYKFDQNLPYLYFIKASAFHKRRKSPTKEYALIGKTIDAWQDVVVRDRGLYAEEAKTRILELQDMQCLHEFRVGELYLSRRDFYAAIRRFGNVLHCGSSKYSIEAAKRLAKCYYEIGIVDQAEKYQEMVNKQKDYEIPEELTLTRSIKNFFYDIVPDFGFIPSWLRVAT